MGMMDHHKAWHFALAASPEDCLDAFEEVIAGAKNAKWRVSRSSKRATAIFEAKAGLAKIGNMYKFARDVEKAARGSEITFEIEESDGLRTECDLWLSKFSKKRGSTNMAPLLRSSMRDVAKRLEALDPSIRIEKADRSAELIG